MIEFYVQIKWLHIVAVLCSGSLFMLRGLAMMAGSKLAMAVPVRILSVSIDTVLLTAALMLVTMLPGAMFANGWLTAKLCLLVVYVVLGSFALKGHTRPIRLACYLGALFVIAMVFGIAYYHHPLGWIYGLRT